MAGARVVAIDERRARLARRHRLAPSMRTDDVADIADSVVALHSSDPVSVYLSALARMDQPSIVTVDDALYDHRSVIRLHAMRRTLWVATVEVAREAHASSTVKLLRPEHNRFVKLLADNGISDDGDAWIADAKEQTLAALHAVGEATTRQLGEAVPALREKIQLSPGKRYAATQQAHVRVLLHLGFEGVIVRTRPVGTWINAQYRWAATDDWVSGGITGMDQRAASASIVSRWLHAFGPGTTADVQWWMGWNGRDTTRALTDIGAVEVDIETPDGTTEPGWLAADDAEAFADKERWVALLPSLDPTTMGWKRRDWYIDPSHVADLFDSNGNGGPTIWVDGRVVGSWAQRADGEIALGWLVDVPATRRRQVERAARDLGTTLGEIRFARRFPTPLQMAIFDA